MPQDNPAVQPGLGWACCAPHISSQPRAPVPASGPHSVLGFSIQLPAPQPAQRQFLILLVHLCFGHPCFTALYRRLMGKRFCQGKEGGRAGGQMFLDIAWHLRNCCSRWRAEKGGTPSLSKVELSSSISFLFPFSTKF